MEKFALNNFNSRTQSFITGLIFSTPKYSMDGLFSRSIQQPIRKTNYPSWVSYSHYGEPILRNEYRLSGYSRNWGDAPSSTQSTVMKKILEYSSDLSKQDQSILLGIARIESGFNPDAAATTTSASGVFQIIDSTAKRLGINDNNRFDTDSNIKAGIKLYKQNLQIAKQKFPTISGNDKASLLYALYHDGPSLRYGGAQIADSKLLPYLDTFYQIAQEYQSASEAMD